LEGPKAVEVFDDLRVGGGVIEVLGMLLPTTMRYSTMQGGKSPAAVKNFLGRYSTLASCPFKGGGAFVVGLGPIVIVGMAG
jgi:hypothetical protein